MTKDDPNTKTVDALYARLETTVEPDLINGGHAVRLNPDADKLPGSVTTLTARQARLLARDLLFQADEADRRDGGGDNPVEWAGRTFGQLTADEKVRATRQAAACGATHPHPEHFGGDGGGLRYCGGKS